MLFRGLFFAFLACFLGAAGVSAQDHITGLPARSLGQKGLVHGTVKLASGKPLFGVSVKLQSMETGSVRLGFTSEEGYFSFANLPSGNYTVAVEAPGFVPERRQVQLGTVPTHTLTFTLKQNSARASPDGVYTVSVRQLQVPEKARNEYQKGLEKYEKGKIDEAVRHWNKSLELYPQLTESYLQLSRAYFDRKDIPRALEMAQNAVSTDQGNANALCILGYLYVQNKDYGKAEETFLKSVHASNTQWLSHFWLGWLLLKQNKAEEAYDHVVLANQLRPEVPEIHILIFNSLLHLGRIKEAVEELDYFLDHFPDHEMVGKVREKRDSLQKLLAAGKH